MIACAQCAYIHTHVYIHMYILVKLVEIMLVEDIQMSFNVFSAYCLYVCEKVNGSERIHCTSVTFSRQFFTNICKNAPMCGRKFVLRTLVGSEHKRLERFSLKEIFVSKKNMRYSAQTTW